MFHSRLPVTVGPPSRSRAFLIANRDLPSAALVANLLQDLVTLPGGPPAQRPYLLVEAVALDLIVTGDAGV
jgi:hypothetical protein